MSIKTRTTACDDAAFRKAIDDADMEIEQEDYLMKLKGRDPEPARVIIERHLSPVFAVICAERDRLEAERTAIQAAFAPVLDWYNGDGERDDLPAMLADAVADLQKDRAECLRLAAVVERLPRDKNGRYAPPGTVVDTPDGSYAVIPGCVGDNAPIDSVKGSTFRVCDCVVYDSTEQAAREAQP